MCQDASYLCEEKSDLEQAKAWAEKEIKRKITM
jgi:hypothetical protein